MGKKITFDMEEMDDILKVETPENTGGPEVDAYVLVIIDADYADEFDVCHASVMTIAQYNDCVKTSKENIGSGGGRVGFGTNEDIEFSSFNEYMRNISVKDISEEDYKAFNRMFGGDFGMIGHYFPYER